MTLLQKTARAKAEMYIIYDMYKSKRAEYESLLSRLTEETLKKRGKK
jgi:hypothetical protein